MLAETRLDAGGGSSNPHVAKIAIEQRSKKFDVVEPQVISEELLLEGVEEPVKEDGETWDAIEFPKVTSLRLSFFNIIEISNLNNFDSLKMLRLDNNIIDRITNLDHLSQLTWLDLSFNNIREIEGLDKLCNLTDLSLYHNQIEHIGGLDSCRKLNILSLGHNNIQDLDQMNYLRPFPNLRCVCFEGNKVCNHDSYNQHVLAYLVNLKYLDYMLIDRKAVKEAVDCHAVDDLTDIREKEADAASKLHAQKVKEAKIQELKASFLDCTEDLFEDLFGEEPAHVTYLQSYAQMKEDYRDKLAEEIKLLRSRMEGRNERRMKMIGSFEKAVSMAEKEGEAETLQLVGDFRRDKKKVLARLEDSQQSKVDEMVQRLFDDLKGLESTLLSSEIQLQESIDEAIATFESDMQKVKTEMSEMAKEFIMHLEELEKGFNVNLSESANSEVDTFLQNQDSVQIDNFDTEKTSESVNEKARHLGNKEEMINQCATFCEARLSFIQTKEDDMTKAMDKWLNDYFDNHRKRQYHRNRQRITDIRQIVEENREDITLASDPVDYEDEMDDGDQFMSTAGLRR